MVIIAILFFLTRISANAQVPTISTFSPLSGPIGTVVTISGTNFSNTLSNNIVFFGATKASILTASSTSLTVTVPSGSTYKNISVTNLTNHLTAYSSIPFLVTFLCGNLITEGAFSTVYDFIGATATDPYDIAIADFDGDGMPDIATANAGFSQVTGENYPFSIFRNTSTSGNISFAWHENFGINGTSAGQINTVDLDGDGKLDIIARGIILRNTSSIGTISFASPIPTQIANDFNIADINGDGKPDFVNFWGQQGGDTYDMGVMLNTSTLGNITFINSYNIRLEYEARIVQFEIADLDGDGKPDLAVPNQKRNSFSIYKNTSTIDRVSFNTKVDFITNNSPYNITIGDLDGDGRQDIIITYVTAYIDSTLSIYRNSSNIGNISFANKMDYLCNNRQYHVTIYDMDGDGKPEISDYSILKNNSSNGNISFSNGILHAIAPLHESEDYNFHIGDLNGDDKPDIVKIRNGASIGVYKNHIGDKATMNSKSSDFICSGNRFRINLTSDIPATYEWVAADNPNITGESTTPQKGDINEINITNNTNSVQTVIYTITPTATVSSCPGPSQTFTLIVNPLPVVTANATFSSACFGTNAPNTLTGGGASKYIWSGGITNGVPFQLYETITKTYTVTGTDINGCVNTDSITIKVNPLPTITASATPALVCAGDKTTLNASGANTYKWSTGATGNSIVVSPPGTTASTISYTVIGTDEKGCQNTATTDVFVDVPIIAIIKNTVCTLTSTTLVAKGAINYSWSTNQTGNSIYINPNIITTYTVIGTDFHGCKGTSSLNVGPNPTANFNYSVNNMTVKFTMFDPTVAVSGGFLWDYGNGMTSTIAQTPFVTYNSSGTYTACLQFNSLSNNCVICANISVPGIYNGTTNLITGIDENEVGKSITIYPNPFTSHTTIAFSEEQKNTIVKIMDVNGKEIRLINFSGKQLIIDKGEMRDGVYFVQIIDRYKNIVNRKIITQ